MSFYLPIFKTLNEADVRYVVVGGLAAVLHGHVRLTSDIDLIIDLKKEEAEKAIKAFDKLGFKPRLPVDAIDFSCEEIRRSWIDEKGMEVFSFYNEVNPILSLDVFVHHPILFEDLMKRAVEADIDGVCIRICSIEDLIALKQRAGRPQDIDDIEKLQLIKQENEK